MSGSFQAILLRKISGKITLTGMQFKLKLKADCVPSLFDFSSLKMKCQMKGKRPCLALNASSHFEPRLSPKKRIGSTVGGTFVKHCRQEVCINFMLLNISLKIRSKRHISVQLLSQFSVVYHRLTMLILQ